MKPVRENVSFGQLTTPEVMQVLVKGEMPNGTTIDLQTRKDGLDRLLPMFIKDWCLGEDEYKLIEEARKILAIE